MKSFLVMDRFTWGVYLPVRLVVGRFYRSLQDQAELIKSNIMHRIWKQATYTQNCTKKPLSTMLATLKKSHSQVITTC